MRISHSLFRTERGAPSESQLVSHQLLIRAGLVRQISSGIYSLTPLAMRTMSKIVQIVKEEMGEVGGQEVLLPVVQPATLWEQSGRYGKIDSSLARWKDRNGQDMVLAMTHEEAVTDLVRHFVHSYRQLPIMLYQVQMKFRDEARPRGGLVRLREFLMKDAYSFHANSDSLDVFYEQMIVAYETFYRRCGVNVLRVEADTGMMGGGISHEFMVISEGGEDTLVICRRCGYAANHEVAVAAKHKKNSNDPPTWQMYIGNDGRIIAVGMPKEAEVNELKLSHVLGISEVRKATSVEVQKLGVSLDGWIESNNGSMENVSVILDDAFADDLLTQLDSYLLVDVTAVAPGHHCLNCGDVLETVRGIEVGNIFKLGTYYAKPMKATFTERDGTPNPFIMGCYGIGITRMLACIIEDNHDDHGIVWPESVAPYIFHLITIGTDEDILDTADGIYRRLGAERVLYDDRHTTTGVKFMDADLLGLPYRLTVSRKLLAEGTVELKNRRTGDIRLIALECLEETLLTN